MKKTLAIIGMGLMGGSLGLAVRQRRSPYRVIGVGRKLEKLKRAKKLHACDAITIDLNEGVKDADIVVICTPVDAIVPMVKKILPHLKKGAVVTDIGSVKSPILIDVGKVLDSSLSSHSSSLSFVGGHPLAGSEKTGAENAQAGLYENATVVLTPLTTSSSSLNVIERLWRSVGARPLVMQADIHDILVAQTSHLPHVLASAFVQLVSHLQSRDSNTARLLAGSFRDTTRIVDSDSGQWAEISRANQKFIVGAIKSFRDILNRILQKVEGAGDSYSEWESLFSSAKESRASLLAGKK